MKKIPFEDDHLSDESFGINGLDHSMYEDEENKRKKKKKHKKDKTQQLNGSGPAETPQPELGALSFTDSPVGWYNAQEAKGNIGNAALKGLIDVGATAIGSTYIAAALGKYAPYVGAAIAIVGHYMGDKTGIIRTIGTGIVAYSIAKSKENNSEDSTLLARVYGVKDEIVRAFLLKKYKLEEGVSGLDDVTIEPTAELVDIKVKPHTENTADLEGNPFDQDESQMEGLDFSEFDKYDNFLAREAEQFAAENEHLQGYEFDQDEPDLDGYEEDFTSPDYENELNYSPPVQADPDTELLNLDMGAFDDPKPEEDY